MLQGYKLFILSKITFFLIFLLFIFSSTISFSQNSNDFEKILNSAKEKYEVDEYKDVIEILNPIIEDSPEAQYYTGFSYFYLNDDQSALQFFLKCKDTYDDCNIGLGYTYHYLNENELAVKYLEPNIDYENEVELFYLALSYSSLGNYTKAFEFSLKCAELGDADCQNNVGHFYDHGRGTDQNSQLAFYWYSKSHEQNWSPHPTTSLAAMYLDGQFVDQSYSKAFELYEQAAEKDFDRANYALGIMYEHGKGTSYNYEKAKEYYMKAFDLGHQLALDRIDALEGDQFKAKKLGEIYRTGSFYDVDYISQGVPIDSVEALFWYKVAEYLGSGDAESFEAVLAIASDKEKQEASKNFEIWKKNLGFDYDEETLEEITPYYLEHEGTGFYINSEYLLTNMHVAHVDDNYMFKCDKITGYDPYSGTYEVYEKVNTQYLPKIEDVDLLKSKQKHNYETLISDDDVFMGDEVIVIGYPKGKEVSKYPKMSTGIVNSEIGTNNNPNEFISDAVSYGGSSGSPVYSTSGNLVGILWGGDNQLISNNEGLIGTAIDPNVSFVLKSSYLKEFLDLNNIDYKTATNDEELKFSKIAKNERGKIRLLECYIKDNS